MTAAPQHIHKYFQDLNLGIEKAYGVATLARKKGYDPEPKVDIPLAKNMAERVEGLISVVAPQLAGTGMIKRIQKLEVEYSALDWRVGFKIAEEVANEKFCKFSDKREAMEVGIRTGFAYLTGGIVSAPLEGFIELKIKKRNDGREYFSICYAGPIRGAGGTAAALSVILSDYIRIKMGYAPYDPTEQEINRYVTEVYDYHERAVNLQYLPSVEELRFLVKHVPVEINGDPTEKIEVSNYKDLPRVETNRIRGGLCLVLAEGIAQKSPKLWKRMSAWGKEFGLEWGFLENFLALQKTIKSKMKAGSGQKTTKISPNYVFISDLVAGRPVLTEPMAIGGLRLRYGRSRISGFSAASLHPATIMILNNYIATGTQLKIERPGKAAAITPCDSILGPLVKIEGGSVLQLNSQSQAKEVQDKIEEIIFLGDILINYGDFSENGHVLVPNGYCEEHWIQELEKATVNIFGSFDTYKLSDLLGVEEETLSALFKDPLTTKPGFQLVLEISKKLNIPLHPQHTFYWKLITPQQLMLLVNWLGKAKTDGPAGAPSKIIFPKDKESKRALEEVGVPHLFVNNEYVVLEKDVARAFFAQLQNLGHDKLAKLVEEGKSSLEIINLTSMLKIKDKAGTFIGARMGRPEKAKQRKMTGSPQVLFPVGEEGGRLRCFQSSLEAGKVRSNFPLRRCEHCNTESIYPICETCSRKTKQLYYCKSCGVVDKPACPKHGNNASHALREIDIKHYFESALKKLGARTFPDLIKGVRGTSNKDHIPEHLVKGILRAKYGLYVNKDGTTRFDMSELPLTHFKPFEVGTPIEKLKEMGYVRDIKGNPLVGPDQILEILPQDIILPSSIDALDEQADEVVFKIANYVDDLLEGLYGMEKYYNLKTKSDLVGHLVVGLAPHISAGIVGRIVGFSDTQAFFAHPFYHAAMRRDADGDEACIILLMDALLNFSRQFLPNKRGSRTMDSPLVLTSMLIPSEIDDQAHGIDVVWKYPLEFYESTEQYKMPWDVQVEQVKHRLGKEQQYFNLGFTHPVDNINMGVKCSAYKSLPSMEEKLKGQMDLAKKIRAVTEVNVARMVIEKHFLKDTKGNLRKFSMQQFRCVKCNEKFRRPPIIGKCLHCGGKILFTISEGSVIKYLDPSISLAEKYSVPPYLKQTLELLKRGVEDNFGKEKEMQTGLGKWFG